MLFLLLFIIGACAGSFLNVLADRLPRGESVLSGRSYCESCKKKLSAFDLIPLVSFVLLRGKCRYCRVRLSWYYPIVELTTGILFVVTYYYGITNYELRIANVIELSYLLVIVSSLIAIFFADLKYGIIPDQIIFPAIAIDLLYLLLIHNSLFIIHFLSALGGCLFFLLLFLGTKGKGMGFGDVKLAFFMGMFLGFPEILISMYVAFLTGAAISIILIIRGKKKLKSTIPFGPFLVFGTLISLFLGDKLIGMFKLF